MKVLHIVGGELSGGAARGAYWLHQGLLYNGIDSKILSNTEDTLGDRSVTSICQTKNQKIQNLIRSDLDQFPAILYLKRKKVIFSTSFIGYDFRKHPLYDWADIIQLHWVNRGLVNIKHLSNIEKPIIWTMRDMWPFTGGCHYSNECDNYRSDCGNCKQLGSSHKFDLSRIVHKRKRKYIPHHVVLVGLSHWLSQCAKKSSLFNGFRIETIPNCVNTEIFYPIEKNIARKKLGIPENKKIILSGALNLNDFYKGFDKYIEAIPEIKSPDLHFVFFGKVKLDIIDRLKIGYTSLGFLNNDTSLRLAYSAADVFVAPSLIESFGKTLIEAMACGTPVVCFNATGPKDIVDHEKNGYLATPFDSVELATGIDWVLNNDKSQELCQNAHEKVLNRFDARVTAQQYIQLYKDFI
jgi:glycosyltransferase involved in cell wall biosynthesis